MEVDSWLGHKCVAEAVTVYILWKCGGTLVAERKRGLPGTNNADKAIQSERYRRHWSGGYLNVIDRSVVKDYRDWLRNVSSP